MKTSANNLQTILGSLAIAGLLFFSNINTAQSSVLAGENPRNSTVSEMMSNAHYWVEQLRDFVNSDKPEESTICTASQEVCKMEENPAYWSDYLKQTIDQEENTTVGTIESDPYYWQHYLEAAVSSDTTSI